MASPAPIERDGERFVTRWAAGPDRPPSPSAAADAAIDAVRDAGGGHLVLWVERSDDGTDATARAAGFTPWRTLLNMRCALPPAADVTARAGALPVRAFTDDDAEAFLLVNNRAFAWHPEQGDMTLDGLRERRAEAWFDPDGFLLHERDGRLAGFCWTKIHPPEDHLGDPAMGEIYAIAVDPDFHGQGIGGPLTVAGLDWLARQGLAVGMLYVESDNDAAVRTYERIGFTVHHVDRAYTLDVTPHAEP